VYHQIARSCPLVLSRLLQMLAGESTTSRRPSGTADSTRIKIALCISALLSHSAQHFLASPIFFSFALLTFEMPSTVDCQLDLVDLDVVSCFTRLLTSSNQRLQFYAIAALRNLSTYYRAQLLLLQPPPQKKQSSVCFVLTNVDLREASVRHEIHQIGGLAELLRLVHGSGRAAVSVARLEAMRTISNLSVTG